ncbi:NAD(P)-binding domain-containing protein [Prosthecomicrobium pneumaticum]|uniref:Trimethylamine monooxygenase n=1 Tax=Prosthecomicrobium pneumaticum TaxID=81895 RepID=A0A7W9CVU0_9HYPH|nr:NAD(P)-binding domain-containing protein [Prosthecomicrobium pneumaticum]MBB5752282.1 NADPH-dependent 2,4-dienoyl-CoA reductase/sulfur reductase-like enzyme [Prosthecomicrobium pneumaticum]
MPGNAERIAVLGGGPAGIAAARWLGARGFSPVVFERGGRLGGLWTQGPCSTASAEGLTANTPRAATRFADLDHDEAVAARPSADAISAYLTRYTAGFALGTEIRLRTSVDSVARHPIGGWMVRSTTAATTRREEAFARVVVATGFYAERSFGGLRGADRFTGPGGLVHSSGYRGAAEHRGRRVLVIGGGPAGGAIALDLAGAGVSVALAGPAWLSSPAAHPARCDAALAALCAEGRLLPAPPVASVTTHGVYFADGTAETYDSIIAATGYRPALSIFPPGLEAALVTADGRIALAESTFHPDLPGIAVLGHFDQRGAALPVIELQARAVAYLWSGVAAMPAQARLAESLAAARSGPRPDLAETAARFARLAGVSPPHTHCAAAALMAAGHLVPELFRLAGPDADPRAELVVAREAAALCRRSPVGSAPDD